MRTTESVGLAGLPDDALYVILSGLAIDEHARAATLSRRFAALVASPKSNTRLTLACSRLPKLPDAVVVRLLRRASLLRELDVSSAHPEADSGLGALSVLSDAQRQQLTRLRSFQTGGAEFLSLSEVRRTLRNCPNLRCFETSVGCTLDWDWKAGCFDAGGDDEPSAALGLVAALPRLQIRRLKTALTCHPLVRNDDGIPVLATELARIFERCGEVVFTARGMNENQADAWQAFERALIILKDRGCKTTFIVKVSLRHSDDRVDIVAALLRLASQPRVRGLDLDGLQADDFSRLLDVLATPGCAVRRLRFSHFSFELSYDDESAFMKLQKLLCDEAFPLECLALSDCVFDDGPHNGGTFATICLALAGARALREFRVSGGNLRACDAESLALLVRANRSLRTLDVRSQVLNEGLVGLAAALALPHTMLEQLFLYDVFDEASPKLVGLHAAQAFSAALQANTRLREFHMSVNDAMHSNSPLGPNEAAILWNAVAASTTLRCATLPCHVWVENYDSLDPHGLALHELKQKAMYAENPRAADLRFPDHMSRREDL